MSGAKNSSLDTPTNAPLAPDAPEILPGEKRWISGLLLALLGLRVWGAWKIEFTSDESQHLHVVWAWANHLWPYHGIPSLPYRDVFDNHTPLFHLLCAPLFRLFGETAQVMISMRLAMIPIFAASLWFVAKIGAALFSRRAGWWAAVFAGWFPFLLLKSVEFRTDDLWMAVWLAAVAIAIGGPLTPRRMGAVGLILGAAFGVSMKTVLLTLALLLAGLVVFVLGRQGGAPGRTRAALAGLGAAFAGLLIVPAAVVIFFAARHAADALYYGTIGHNLIPDAAHGSRKAWRHFVFPVALPPLIFAASWIFRRTADRAQGLRRALVFLTCGFFVVLLRSYWSMITGQDFLPVAPLLIALATPGVLALGGAGWPRLALPLAVVALEAAGAIKMARLRAAADVDLGQLAEVLHLTDPGDYVMDAKSGAIFRRRPFYYALEDLTEKRLHRGLIKDEIVERMIATRTCVASDKRLTGRVLDFLRANYIPAAGRYRIAGQYLHPDADGRVAFGIEIATAYVLVTPQGPASGKLDGQPYRGKVSLDAGPHEFVSDAPSKPLGVVWAQAMERGFQPNFSSEPETKPDAP